MEQKSNTQRTDTPGASQANSSDHHLGQYVGGGAIIPPEKLDDVAHAHKSAQEAPSSSGSGVSGRSPLSSRGVIVISIIVVLLSIPAIYFMTQRTKPLSTLFGSDGEELVDVGSYSLSDYNDGIAGFNQSSEDANIDVEDVDTDSDNLTDSREEALGTDPENPDTDGDGFLDGEEVATGHDPLKNSHDAGESSDGSPAVTLYEDSGSGLSFSFSSQEAELSAPIVRDGLISSTKEVAFPYLKIFDVDVLTAVPTSDSEMSEFGFIPLDKWQEARLALDETDVPEDSLKTIQAVVPIYGDYLRGDGSQPIFMEGSVFTTDDRARGYDAFYELVETDPEPTLTRVTTFIENDLYSYQFITWYRGITIPPEDLLAQLRAGEASDELQASYALHSEIIASVDVKNVRKPSIESSSEVDQDDESVSSEEEEYGSDDVSIDVESDAPIQASVGDAFADLVAGADTSSWRSFSSSRLPIELSFPSTWYFMDCGGVAGFHPYSVNGFCSGQPAMIHLEDVPTVDAAIDRVEEVIDGESSRSTLQVSGASVQRISGSSGSGFVDAIVFERDGSAYLLFFDGESEDSSEHNDIFAGMTSSLSF